MKIVIIKDDKTNMIFGFMSDRPAICAQGDTIETVIEKIKKIKNIDKLRNK